MEWMCGRISLVSIWLPECRLNNLLQRVIVLYPTLGGEGKVPFVHIHYNYIFLGRSETTIGCSNLETNKEYHQKWWTVSVSTTSLILHSRYYEKIGPFHFFSDETSFVRTWVHVHVPRPADSAIAVWWPPCSVYSLKRILPYYSNKLLHETTY